MEMCTKSDLQRCDNDGKRGDRVEGTQLLTVSKLVGGIIAGDGKVQE